MGTVEGLAAYRRGIERIRTAWPGFSEKRAERLRQQARYGPAAEKVAENIIEDLFTLVLDWSLGDLNNQVGYADILVTGHGIGYLVMETKRPGALAWNRRAVARALEQAQRYAGEQRVRGVAVSDGVMLYAADIAHGGLQDRVFCRLDGGDPPLDLWWLSVHGIYRPRQGADAAALELLPEGDTNPAPPPATGTDVLLHPKYGLPARCFAYVGDAARTSTWKLPFRNADGSIDAKRLPKAIGAILTNYRGARVGGIPEADVPAVLLRLARAAASLGHMPPAAASPARVYVELAMALTHFGILDHVEIAAE